MKLPFCPARQLSVECTVQSTGRETAYRYKYRVYSMLTRVLWRQREKIEQRLRDETVAPTAFLWGAYYPSRYYYEVSASQQTFA